MDIAEKVLLLKQDYDDVHEAGKQAQYDADWDMLQANGARDKWEYGFQQCNIVGALRPKHKIALSGSIARMFIGNKNMTTIYNWGFPTTGVTSCQAAFSECSSFLGFVDENGELIKDKPFFGNSVTDYRFCFQNNEKIEYICIDVSSVNNLYTGTFGRCLKLKRLKITGGTIKVSIQLQYSPLDVESMVNVIELLENYSGTEKEFNYTAQFSEDCWAELEKTTPPEGYSTWRDYVANLGWNS